MKQARTSIRKIKLAVAGIGIRLKDAAIIGKMRLWMFTGTVPGVIEHRRRWRRSAKRSIVPDIAPYSTGDGLAESENRHGRVITVDPFRRERMAFNPPHQRVKNLTACANRVCCCRQADWCTFQSKTFDLAIEGNVLAELVSEQSSPKGSDQPTLSG